MPVFSKFKISTLILAITLVSLSCSSSDDSDNEETVEQETVTSSDLVGTWTGTVDGSLGSASITLMLEDDGTASAETTSEVLCPLEGSWSLNNNLFNISAIDDCDGTSVTLSATASKTFMRGNWSASSGNNGTFVISKQ